MFKPSSEQQLSKKVGWINFLFVYVYRVLVFWIFYSIHINIVDDTRARSFRYKQLIDFPTRKRRSSPWVTRHRQVSVWYSTSVSGSQIYIVPLVKVKNNSCTALVVLADMRLLVNSPILFIVNHQGNRMLTTIVFSDCPCEDIQTCNSKTKYRIYQVIIRL